MKWYEQALIDLASGKETIIRPFGNSMKPLILSGDTVKLGPCIIDSLDIGDIVLCKVKNNMYLHLVKAISKDQVLIGNNRGGTNGWTKQVYGKSNDR